MTRYLAIVFVMMLGALPLKALDPPGDGGLDATLPHTVVIRVEVNQEGVEVGVTATPVDFAGPVLDEKTAREVIALADRSDAATPIVFSLLNHDESSALDRPRGGGGGRGGFHGGFRGGFHGGFRGHGHHGHFHHGHRGFHHGHIGHGHGRWWGGRGWGWRSPWYGYGSYGYGTGSYYPSYGYSTGSESYPYYCYNYVYVGYPYYTYVCSDTMYGSGGYGYGYNGYPRSAYIFP